MMPPTSCRVSVRRRLIHRCPFRDEIDVGMIEASWTGDDIELHALAGFLDAFDAVDATHEAVTVDIVSWLRACGAVDPKVTTYWKTAGLDVEVCDAVAVESERLAAADEVCCAMLDYDAFAMPDEYETDDPVELRIREAFALWRMFT